MSMAGARLFDLSAPISFLTEAEPLPRRGSVLRASAHLVTVDLPGVKVGQQVVLGHPRLKRLGEVVAVEQRHALVMPYSAVSGVRSGMPVESLPRADRVSVGSAYLGRVVDALGQPLTGAARSGVRRAVPCAVRRLIPLTRRRIDRVIPSVSASSMRCVRSVRASALGFLRAPASVSRRS